MIKRLFPLIAVWLAFAAWSGRLTAAAPEITLPELLKHIASARQPQAGTPPLNSFRMLFSTQLAPNNLKVLIIHHYQAPDKLKITVSVADAINSSRGFDGKQAWSFDLEQCRLLKGAEADSMRFSAALNQPNADWSVLFEHFLLTEHQEKVNGEPCWRLIAQPQTTFRQLPVSYYVSAKDYRIRRVDLVMFSESGPVPSSTIFSNYRNYQGIWLPEKTQTMIQQVPVELKLEAVQVNPEFTPNEFAAPKQ